MRVLGLDIVGVCAWGRVFVRVARCEVFGYG